MLLYKYLSPERIDVLEKLKIRFTQPGDFNDPYEGKPAISGLCSPEDLEEYFQSDQKILDSVSMIPSI